MNRNKRNTYRIIGLGLSIILVLSMAITALAQTGDPFDPPSPAHNFRCIPGPNIEGEDTVTFVVRLADWRETTYPQAQAMIGDVALSISYLPDAVEVNQGNWSQEVIYPASLYSVVPMIEGGWNNLDYDHAGGWFGVFIGEGDRRLAAANEGPDYVEQVFVTDTAALLPTEATVHLPLIWFLKDDGTQVELSDILVGTWTVLNTDPRAGIGSSELGRDVLFGSDGNELYETVEFTLDQCLGTTPWPTTDPLATAIGVLPTMMPTVAVPMIYQVLYVDGTTPVFTVSTDGTNLQIEATQDIAQTLPDAMIYIVFVADTDCTNSTVWNGFTICGQNPQIMMVGYTAGTVTAANLYVVGTQQTVSIPYLGNVVNIQLTQLALPAGSVVNMAYLAHDGTNWVSLTLTDDSMIDESDYDTGFTLSGLGAATPQSPFGGSLFATPTAMPSS